MKKLKLLSLVVVIFITTLSCKKNNNDNFITDPIGSPNKETLMLSYNSGATGTINFVVRYSV